MGGTGYAAAELIKRLVKHPHVELLRVSSVDHIGENIGKVHKNFGDRLPYTFENYTSAQITEGADVVFLALPHKVSFQKAPELFPYGVKIVDFSGDYRIRDAKAYEKYYKATHSNPENIPSFVYGLPELNRDRIREANRIANPGCFPTGTAISMLPLAKHGLLKGKVRVVAPTGSSGSGVTPQEGTHHPTRSRNLKSYKVLDHQHQPEMEQTLRDAGGENISVDFIPISAPLTRGMLINTLLDLPSHITVKEVHDLFRDYYKTHPFVRVLPLKSFPEVVAVADTNFVELGISLKEEHDGTKTFACVTAFDNLVKGAAGQAIQNMNLMFGLEETLALDEFGSWP